MIIGVVVLAIIVGVVVVASSQRHGAPTPGSTGVPEGTPRAPAPAPEPAPPPGANGLDEALGRWLGASLVTADQADAIRAFEVDLARRPAPPAPTPSEHVPHRHAGRVPVAAEALGYLGGSLIMAGMVLIVGHAWPDLALGAKLALTGVAAAALVAGGALVPAAKDPAFERIRSFLWLASSAATAVFAVVVARDGFDAESAQTVALVASAAVAIESGALWQGRVRPAQQAPALIAALVAVGSAVAVATDANNVAMGLAVWLASAAMAATGLRHRFSTPLLTAGIGAIGLLVGAVITAADNGGGLLFGSATTLLLLAPVVIRTPLAWPERLVFGIIGLVAAQAFIPGTIAWFANDAGLLTGAVVWVGGATLAGLGLRRIARTPITAEVIGSFAMVGGAAVTGTQFPSAAPALGLFTALLLLGVGMVPGGVVLSIAGSIGLLVNVPWAIEEWFPGENRAPLLILVSGALIIAIAVLLTRLGGRFHHELGHRSEPPTEPAPDPGTTAQPAPSEVPPPA